MTDVDFVAVPVPMSRDAWQRASLAHHRRRQRRVVPTLMRFIGRDAPAAAELVCPSCVLIVDRWHDVGACRAWCARGERPMDEGQDGRALPISVRDCYAMAVVVGMLARNNGIDATRVFELADELLAQRGGGKQDETHSASE